MNKPQTRLLALLLMLSMLAGMSACAARNEALETEPAPIEIVVKPKEPEKCTELGTPLADARVRRALALAIDMDTIIEALLYDKAQKAAGLTLPDDGPETSKYDPERAKELLAEAGWPSDYVLDVVYFYDDQLTVDILNVIGSYWDAVGVKAEFRKLEGDVAAQLWTAPEDPEEGDSAVEWDLAYGAVAALAESEFYDRFASHECVNIGTTLFYDFFEKSVDDSQILGASRSSYLRDALYSNVCPILGHCFHDSGKLVTEVPNNSDAAFRIDCYLLDKKLKELPVEPAYFSVLRIPLTIGNLVLMGSKLVNDLCQSAFCNRILSFCGFSFNRNLRFRFQEGFFAQFSRKVLLIPFHLLIFEAFYFLP